VVFNLSTDRGRWGGKKKEKEHSTSTFKKEPFILKQGNGKYNASYK